MRLIHYGHERWQPKLFKPIVNRPSFVKPCGGLWASPVDAEFGWIDWCKVEDFHPERLAVSFEFELAPSANVFVVDSMTDLQRFPHQLERLGQYLYQYPDFEKARNTGIDAVYLTDKGQCETRFGGYLENEKHMDLYGWDCESVLVLRPQVVVFDAVRAG